PGALAFMTSHLTAPRAVRVLYGCRASDVRGSRTRWRLTLFQPAYDARNLMTVSVARARVIESLAYLSAFRAPNIPQYLCSHVGPRWSRLLHRTLGFTRQRT